MNAEPVRFKTTEAKDVKIGDVQMTVDMERRKSTYYYSRAESVFIGDISEPLFDGITGNLVGHRTTNCVEIVWQPLNFEGKTFTLRYHQQATLDIASNVPDVNELVQSEDFEDWE